MNSVWLYEQLARLPGLRRHYPLKVMAVALCATQVPLLVFFVVVLIQNAPDLELETVLWTLWIALVLTAAGSGLTYFALRQLLAPIQMTSTALKTYLKDGKLPYLPTQFEDVAGRLMSDTNLTLRKLDQTIRRVTDYDTVTGLPNANSLKHRIQQEIKDAYTYQWLMATITISLVGMQNVGSTWGSENRDRVLREVAHRLSRQLQSHDLLTRTETYTFTVVRGGLQNEEHVEDLAQKILKVFSMPFDADSAAVKGRGAQIYISAGAGISVYPTDGKTSEILLQRSAAACQQSLREGRNTYRFYIPTAQKASEERLTIEQDLQTSFENGHFYLLYQPRIDLKTGHTVATEALVRWKHPRLGLISPGQFIPIAEETGLIVPMGEWILKTACAQAQAWHREGLPPIRMAVNISALQLRQGSLVDDINRILNTTGLPPHLLELELTESIFIKDSERLIELLNAFRQMGIRLALDDFGTGYSSLSYLSRLPVDTLKVDQSFTRRMTTRAEIRSIVQAIVAMAKTLNLQITAEGIETHEHLQMIAEMDCHEAQGYLFSRPISSVAMARFVQQPPLPYFLPKPKRSYETFKAESLGKNLPGVLTEASEDPDPSSLSKDDPSRPAESLSPKPSGPKPLSDQPLSEHLSDQISDQRSKAPDRPISTTPDPHPPAPFSADNSKPHPKPQAGDFNNGIPIPKQADPPAVTVHKPSSEVDGGCTSA